MPQYPKTPYRATLNVEAIAADTWYILVDKSNNYLYSHPSTTSHLNLLSVDLSTEKATDGDYDIWMGLVYENDATDGSIQLIHVWHVEAVGNPTDSDDRFVDHLDLTCNGIYPRGLDLSIVSEVAGSDLLTDGEFEEWTADDLDEWTESHGNIDAAEDESGVSGSAAKLTDSGGGHYIYQAVTVTAGKLHKLAFDYKNKASDFGQIGIYDATNSADILAATDLSNSTSYAGQQTYYFVAPDACTSVQIRLGCKNAADEVYYDQCTLKAVNTIEGCPYLRGARLVDKTGLQNDAKNLYTAAGLPWSSGGDQFSAAVGDIVVWVEEVTAGTIDICLSLTYIAN